MAKTRDVIVSEEDLELIRDLHLLSMKPAMFV